MEKSKKLQLIIEKGDGELWGRVNYDGDLITESGNDIDAIEKSLRNLLKKLHNLQDVKFEYAYDLTALFKKYKVLNATAVGAYVGVNPGLFRQYTSGKKYASPAQMKKIETGIKKVGKELAQVELVS